MRDRSFRRSSPVIPAQAGIQYLGIVELVSAEVIPVQAGIHAFEWWLPRDVKDGHEKGRSPLRKAALLSCMPKKSDHHVDDYAGHVQLGVQGGRVGGEGMFVFDHLHHFRDQVGV